METSPAQTVVLSDLHLSEGWDPETRRLSRHEDFFFDEPFARFLESLRDTEDGAGPTRLIVNGDFTDFLQILSLPPGDEVFGERISPRERTYGLGTSPAKTLCKLDILVAGHPTFFGALAAFLGRGNELVIVPGNHDIEWVMPEVQESFREILVLLGDDGAIRSRILFSPWFFFDREASLYVEHGNQYDPLNSFDHFLCPFLPDGRINLPAGSFFVRYLFNRLETDFPFADNMKPPQRFLRWVLKSPRRWKYLTKYPRFFIETLAKAGPLDPAWKEELDLRQQEALEELAAARDLPVGTLMALKDLWVPSAIHNKALPGLLVEFFSASRFGNPYFRERARRIRGIAGARYVLFGHTHTADLALLDRRDGRRSEYFNTASWTPFFPADPEEELLKESSGLAFFEARFDKAAGRHRVNLLRWNDNRGVAERVLLFAERT
jgi:UDP-2,3-diacylglucosamine pyrophosphatase LpxH